MSASGPQQQLEPVRTEPEKRRPGRPRKPQPELTGEPVPKRPRGRPKGSKNKSPPKAAEKTESTAEKRQRGRPRKWPQKTVQEKPSQKEEVGAEPEED